MKRVQALTLALAITAFGLVGCGSTPTLECDVDDQIEQDSDCGYWRNSQFVWYDWVVKGKVSYSPEGFQPVADDDTAPAESGGSGHKSKSRKNKH